MKRIHMSVLCAVCCGCFVFSISLFEKTSLVEAAEAARPKFLRYGKSSSSSSKAARKAKSTTKDVAFKLPMDAMWKDTWKFYVVKTVARATQNKHESSGKTNYGEIFDTLDLSRVDLLTEGGGPYPAFLRVRFPKDGGSPFTKHFYNILPSGVTALSCSIAPSDNLYLRYYVRFPKDFDFSSSGNLPGIAGGILKKSEGTYSASFFNIWYGWNKQGFIEFSGFQDTLKASRTSPVQFSGDGAWHKVEMYVRGNVPPMHKMNGLVEIRYDGKTILYAERALVRTKKEDQFECFSFIGYAGAVDTISNLRKDSWVDIAEVTMSPVPLW